MKRLIKEMFVKEKIVKEMAKIVNVILARSSFAQLFSVTWPVSILITGQ